MKSKLQHFAAFFLAVLLLCTAAWPVSAQLELLSSACVLGADPSDMLSGGGRRVMTEDTLYYIGDGDDAVYELDNSETPLLEGPVARLNYADGVLYYARIGEDSFSLCAFDLETREERVLLADFSGTIGQLYLVNGKEFVFSCSNAIWQFPLDAERPQLMMIAPELWSFVPTAYGIVYATGSRFDYSLYADKTLLAQNVEDYTVRLNIEDGIVCYTSDGADYQMDLASAFAGTAEAEEFLGCPPEEVEETWEGRRVWSLTAEESLLRQSGAIADTRDLSGGPVPLFSTHAYRRPATEGVLNIVRRAQQMLDVKWTPVADGFSGFGYTNLDYGLMIYYENGVTYTGLPYGQGMTYVPWYSSLSSFVGAVSNSESRLYTERNDYWYGSQAYGTDCSAFVSWAWETTANGSDSLQRKTCPTLIEWDKTEEIGRSYTLIQLGDALISDAHAVLVTDVTYNADGTIASIELSQASPTSAYNGCCYSTRYTGTAALQTLDKNYFLNDSYCVFRSMTRNSVSYTHDCVVPLEGDSCEICGCSTKAAATDPALSVGIDVSEWNDEINWSAVASQVDFAIIRVGYTRSTSGAINQDSEAVANIRGCMENGIPFGLYYYAGATTTEKAQEEANAILNWLDELDASPSLPVFYDVEEVKNILTLSNYRLSTVSSAFCNRLKEAGVRAGVYASASIWDDRFASYASYDQVAHWVAHWDTDKLTAISGTHLWQYSNTGKIAGISGNVDMDYWIGPLGDTNHPCTAVFARPSCESTNLVSTCVICGKTMNQPIPGTGTKHVLGASTSETVALPTCTEEGTVVTSIRCSVCGEIVEQTSTKLDPLGHTWLLTSTLTTGETCHESTSLYSCTRCQKTKQARLCASEVFLDTPDEGSWAHDSIDWAFANGVTVGTSATSFSPDLILTRGQALTFLWAAAGRPDSTIENVFQDVSAGDWYYDPVRWASENRITAGTSASTFSPDALCTRSQIVTFLWAAANRPEPTQTENRFEDVSPDDFYCKAVLWAEENQITGGVDATHFAPDALCDRAQMVTFLRAAYPFLAPADPAS
ncbi:MAG: S-layer homology domain-containing protein [Oscillospiraceae bacterium]|nr:S-layer homology domain-containing protein [Oscillospiraceae bacterium]